MISHSDVLFSGVDSPSQLLIELLYEALEKGGEPSVQIVSGSMQPLIQPGDRVIVKHADADQAKFGDIIVFRWQEALVTHRVISRLRIDERMFFLQKGDSNLSASPVPSQDVLAKVVAIGKAGKTFRLDTLWGKSANYAIALCFYLRYIVYSRWRGLSFRVRAHWLSRFCFKLARVFLFISSRVLVRMLYVRLSG